MRILNIETHDSTNMNNKIKGNMYCNNFNDSFSMDTKVFYNEMVANRLLLSTVYKLVRNDGKEFIGIFKEVQRHPVTGQPMHLDVLLLDENKAITMNLKVKLHNKDVAVGLKSGGILKLHCANFDVSFLPKDAINSIDIDIAKLNINEEITTENLPFKNVKFSRNMSIVSIVPARVHSAPVRSGKK